MTNIPYIDSYDLTWRLGSFISGGVIGTAIHCGAEICGIGASHTTILGWVSGLGTVLCLSMLPIPAYLFIRYKLQTPISIADARKLERMLPYPLAPKKFRPYCEVLQLPREQRREYLFRQMRCEAHSR